MVDVLPVDVSPSRRMGNLRVETRLARNSIFALTDGVETKSRSSSGRALPFITGIPSISLEKTISIIKWISL